MDAIFRALLAVVDTVGLMAIASMVYGIGQANLAQKWLRRALLGAVFGLGALVSLFQPFAQIDGYQADARFVFVTLAGAFSGLLGGTIALIITCLARFWIGGAGVVIGLIGTLVVLVAGLLWAMVFPAQEGRRPLSAWIWLTIAASLAIVMAFGLGYTQLRDPVLTIGLALSNFICVFIFGRMLEVEQMRGRRERDLQLVASTDVLTGLANRRALMDLVAAGTVVQGPHALILIDIDRFKSVNDRFGHAAGDEVLRIVGATLAAAMHPQDFAARIGGEEFAVLLRVASRTQGVEATERLRASLRRRHRFAGGEVDITVSAGGIFCAAGVADYSTAFEAADKALYAAKQAGRDLTIFAPDT